MVGLLPYGLPLSPSDPSMVPSPKVLGENDAPAPSDAAAMRAAWLTGRGR